MTSVLEDLLVNESTTDGQRRRLRIFQEVERGVVSRVEQLCENSDIEVADVAVLVVAPSARKLIFDDASDAVATDVILGHRNKLHEFMTSVLPPKPDVDDPYGDLLASAPQACVRLLILDDEAITVLHYGSFVSIDVEPTEEVFA